MRFSTRTRYVDYVFSFSDWLSEQDGKLVAALDSSCKKQLKIFLLEQIVRIEAIGALRAVPVVLGGGYALAKLPC